MLETYKPDVVTLMVGTNNLVSGERPRDVISKIENLVRVCQRANPSTKVVVSGLITRSDRPELNSHIKTIHAVLERNSMNKDFSFMNNANIGFKHLEGDELHLNYHRKIGFFSSLPFSQRTLENSRLNVDPVSAQHRYTIYLNSHELITRLSSVIV